MIRKNGLLYPQNPVKPHTIGSQAPDEGETDGWPSTRGPASKCPKRPETTNRNFQKCWEKRQIHVWDIRVTSTVFMIIIIYIDLDLDIHTYIHLSLLQLRCNWITSIAIDILPLTWLKTS